MADVMFPPTPIIIGMGPRELLYVKSGEIVLNLLLNGHLKTDGNGGWTWIRIP